MNLSTMLILANHDLEERREREWHELLHRPDALPLPPTEERPDIGARLSAVLRGWLYRVPKEPADGMLTRSRGARTG